MAEYLVNVKSLIIGFGACERGKPEGRQLPLSASVKIPQEPQGGSGQQFLLEWWNICITTTIWSEWRSFCKTTLSPGWSCGATSFPLPIPNTLLLSWSCGVAQRDLWGAEVWSDLCWHWGSLKIGSDAMPGKTIDMPVEQLYTCTFQVQLSTLPVAVCFGDGKNQICLCFVFNILTFMLLHHQVKLLKKLKNLLQPMLLNICKWWSNDLRQPTVYCIYADVITISVILILVFVY